MPFNIISQTNMVLTAEDCFAQYNAGVADATRTYRKILGAVCIVAVVIIILLIVFLPNTNSSFSSGNFNNRQVNSDAIRGVGMGHYDYNRLTVNFDEFGNPLNQIYKKYKPVFKEL